MNYKSEICKKHMMVYKFIQPQKNVLKNGLLLFGWLSTSIAIVLNLATQYLIEK